jgi:nitroreductase
MALHDGIGSDQAATPGDMSAWDAIRSRRNVRQYAPAPVAAADLDQILEAARRAPSSQNSQPWDFIAVTGGDELRRLAGVWFGGTHIACSGATIALITAADDARAGRVQFDLGQAAMSIMLAAAALGIGSCHSAVGDQDLARRLLGYPADKTCDLLISLGYPASRPLAPISMPDRRPFDEVVHRARW